MILRMSIAAACLLVALPAVAQDTSSERGKLSYAVGFQIGRDFKARNLDLDVETVLSAIRDATRETEPKVAAAEMRSLLEGLEAKIREEQLEKFKALAEKNQTASEEFLSKNEKKKGIVVLPSGVQYRIIEEGEGKRPTLDSEVQVHYRGSKALSDLEFDSSFARGVPVSFKVNEVLKGWQEVLPLMRQGAKWQVFVPPELAYGPRGQLPAIGPNEALVFDINLVEIKS